MSDQSTKPVKILLVEDDSIDVKAFQRAMKKLKISNPINIAQQIGEALGKDINYVAADPKAFQEAMRPFVTSDWHSDAVAHLFAEIADGTTPGIHTDTFEKIMGRPGRSFKEFVRTFA